MPQSTAGKKQTNNPHTHNCLSFPIFLASSYFVWLVTPPAKGKPKAFCKQKKKSWSFTGIKEGGIVPAPEVQTGSDTFSRKDKVFHIQFLPPPQGGFKVLGERKDGCAERRLYICIRHFDGINTSVYPHLLKEMIMTTMHE